LETLVWDRYFDTGLAEVDRQHRSLVGLFNELHGVLFGGHAVDWPALDQAFQRLVDYAAEHFASEEGLMRKAGVDPRHLELHQQAHREFSQQVGTMWRLRQTLRQPAETIMGFLTSWLGLHIMGVDQQMARQIELIGRGLDGAQAFEKVEERGSDDTRVLLKMVRQLYHVLAEQNNDLVLSNQQLEGRVHERTAQLAQANRELSAANEQLQAFSRTDGLLQIPNRKYFDERLRLELARAVRQRQPLGLLMLDVDCFKRYNDSYGHLAGDACLQAVARAARQALSREVDFLARYGGEELVALLPETDLQGARVVAQRLLDAVRALGLPHAASDVAAVVTLSVGVCSAVPDPRDDGSALIARADAALYEAKRSGRNRVVAAAEVCAAAPTAGDATVAPADG
jgi:hemerythrin